MLRRALVFTAVILAFPLSTIADTTVTLLHFSDYHSHAVPFYAGGRRDRGGIARAISYLKRERKKPKTLVFNGGDMMNAGSPAWSDRYRCAEWPWLNGVVDAVAFGNHDADYGAAEFARCAASIRYPVLAANLASEGKPLFDPYAIFTTGGVRIGVFAVAGGDFGALMKPERSPAAGVRFTDRIEAARAIVARLRGDEKVDAVVVIGHAHREEDRALAKAVPGIDVIFGTHSHIREELNRIEGTQTWFISPWQYLADISRVELTFRDGKLTAVRGGLVPVDAHLGVDRRLARKVVRMQRDLERDPKYRELFLPIGRAASELSLHDQLRSQTRLGSWVMDIVRSAARADVALSTTSSFRQAIAPGPITFEDLRATLPYPNAVLLYELSGADLRQLMQRCIAAAGTDSYCQYSGVRFSGGDISVNGSPLRDDGACRVATTDYLAKVNPTYRELFASKVAIDTGLEVRAVVRKYIEANSPIPMVDGRW